jgi:sorting nexin-29
MKYKSAHDSINRNELYKAMEILRIPSKLIRLVKLTMRDTQNWVRNQSDRNQFILEKCSAIAIACLLFDIGLEKVIRDSKIQTTGIISYKSQQISAYADINITGRPPTVMSEVFSPLEREGRSMGLSIYGRKRRICLLVKQTIFCSPEININGYTF